jgi:hypothetical protein
VARPLGLGVALAIIVSVGAPASEASQPSRTAAASAACSSTTRLPAPPGDRPHETLHVRVLPGLVAAAGTLTVTFAPAVATDRIVFRLWTNSPFYAKLGAGLMVGAVVSAGQSLPTAYPDPTTLVVDRAVAAHEPITVSMDCWAQTGPEQSLPTMLNTPVDPPFLNRIGDPMSFWSKYDFDTFRVGVYVQTVQALASLGPAKKSTAPFGCSSPATRTGRPFRMISWPR